MNAVIRTLRSVCVLPFVLLGCSQMFETSVEKSPSSASLHGSIVKSLDGKPVDLSAYAGKVLLVVNTASECGFTAQYEGLEALYKELAPRGFAVLGFPSNDFGGQEPGSTEEIATFCSKTFGVTFPMFEKVVTKAGPDQSPVFALLGGATGKLPGWNFGKYLVGKDGRAIAFFASTVTPSDAELRRAIEAALAAK